MKLTFTKCLVLPLATGLVGLALALPDRGAAQEAGVHAGTATGINVGTLKGTYVFSGTGYIVDPSGKNQAPFALAGWEILYGNGAGRGVSTTTTKDGVQHRVAYTASYSVNADGSVTETDTDENGEVSHVDEFPLPDGSAFTWVVTDPGMILSGIETRGSGPLDRR
jgi:hypothetical protein